MKTIEIEPYDPGERTWSEPEPATSFRTIDGLPLYWCDERDLVHTCEGADIHADVRLFWTLCGKDAPAGAIYCRDDEAVTCRACRELRDA
ncbi:hypothetical protein [Bradyrhizobium sp. Leo121]|uniref:hypothetical protein n=1 Tax=Bradyrhizobium sp. Leo121 TaxID=1571195 RepID=UPI001028C68C|nr:hypothetical protein [Bradyrhizobium sp. Leo121]RZN14773.1 hypothetical protein CWO90_42515 [Bradyrhizobium sp. Leo121]